MLLSVSVKVEKLVLVVKVVISVSAFLSLSVLGAVYLPERKEPNE